MGRLIDMARSQKRSSGRAGSLIAKARAGTLIKSINDFQDKVMNLGAQYNSRYFDVNGQALPVTWRADSGDWLKTVEPQWKANIAEADALAEQLRGYKDYFDEDTYTKAMDAINAAAAGNRQIYTRAKQEHAAFSPFTNERDYNLVSPWIGQDEATAQKTWNNLNRNLTLAYSQDDAVMIDEAEHALNLFADYYAGTGRSDGVSRMTQEHQQNRRIQRRDEIDAELADAWQMQSSLEVDATATGIPIQEGAAQEYQNQNQRIADLKKERNAVDEDIRKYDASFGSQMNKYIDLTRNVDFAEKSQIINTNNPTVQEMVSFQENPSTRENVPKVDDEFEFYISMSPEDRQKVLDYSIGDTKYAEAAAVLQRGDTKKWAQINENDVKMYRYIKETQGQKAANKYLGDLGRELADRENVKFIEDVEKAGPLAKVGMAMVAAPLSFIGGAAEGFTNGIVTLLGGRPQRTDMANAGRVFNETIMEDLSGGKEGFGWDEVYSAWQSSNESALAMLTSLAFGDGSGKLGTILMGFGAANNEMHRLYQEGASPVEISVGGALAGFTEYMTEQLPMEQLLDNFTGGNAHNVRKMIGLWLKQAGLEGFEEGISTIANALNDYLIRGNRSDIAKEVKVNKAKGLSDGQALWAAIKSVGAEAGEAALQGVMSGAMGGAWSSGVGLANYKAWTKGYAADAMKDADVFHSLMDTAQELSVNTTGRTKVNLDAAIARVSESKNEQNLANLVDRANLAARKVSAKALIESSGSKNPLKRMSLRNKAKSSSEAVMDMEIAERTMAAKIERDSVKRTYTVGNGVTTNAKTGEEIRITGIHRTYENGDPTLVFKLDDGSTIRSDEVSYANDNMAVMAEALAKTGIRADYAQKLLDSVTEKGNAVDAVLGMRAAIEAGSIGANYDMARKEGDAAYLTDKQFRAAYEAGQLLGKNNLNKQIGLASQKTATDANLTQEGGNFVGSFYDGTKSPVSALKNGEGTRTLTNTSKDGTVSSDDVKNMARNSKYMEYFPPSHKNGDTHYWCTIWAKSDLVQSGDYGVVEFVGRYYEIQKHDDADFGYRIISQLSKDQYKRRKGKGLYEYELSAEIKDGGNIPEGSSIFDQKHETISERSIDNQSSVRYGSADGSVHGLGVQSHSEDGKYSLRRDRSDVRSQRRTQGSADPNAQGGQTVKTTESKKADGEPNRLSVAVDPKSLLRSTTQAQVNVLESLAKLFNVNIEIYASSVVDGVRQFTDRRGRVYKGNAAYTRVGNTILVDVNAGDYLNGLMLNAVSHELVHYVREMSPEKFRKLADFVVEKFGEKGRSVTLLIRNKQAKYARQGESLSFDDAYEEVVADSLESMLAQNANKVVSSVAELRQVDADLAKSLVDKLKDTVKKMLGIFKREGFHSNPDTLEGKLFAKWTEYHEQLTSLFSEAVADAADRSARVARRTDTKKSADNLAGGVKYSLKGYTGQQKENWKNAKRILIYDNDEQFLDFIKKARDDGSYNQKIYFGAVSEELAAVIWENTGVNVENYNCSLSAYEVRKIFKDHGDNEKEALRGQQAITEKDMLDIPNVLQSPENIALSKDHYQGKPVIVFSKQLDGKFTVAAVVSDKHLDLFVQTAYKGAKKGNLAMPIGEQAPINTSMTSNGIVSNNSISDLAQNSNPSDEKNSLRNVTERQTIVEMLRTMSTEVEHNKYFQEYLQKASTLDRKQAKLEELTEEWGKSADTSRKQIQSEMEKINNQIEVIENRLDDLAKRQPFRNILARNEAMKSKEQQRSTLTNQNTPESSEVKHMVRNILSEEDRVAGERFADFVDGINKMVNRSAVSKRKYKLGLISDQHQQVVDELMQTLYPEFSSKGYELWIDGTGADHIEKRHGKNGEQDSTMQFREDKMMVPWITRVPDDAEFVLDKKGEIKRSDRFRNNDGSRTVEIRIKKNIPGWIAFVSECAIDGENKRIYITSAYKTKDSTNRVLNMESNNSLQPTSKTPVGNRAINDSIRQNNQDSQEGTEKNSLRNVTERQTIVEMLRTMSTEVEHNKYFQEYLQKASILDRQQSQLDALTEEWRELAFQNGKRSVETKARLQEIRTEVDRLRSTITKMDRRLLALGDMRPFRNLVENAKREQKAKDKEKMNKYRQQLKYRADRDKVVRVLKDIGSYILHSSKEHHIPSEMRDSFIEVLSQINLDFSAGSNLQVADYLNRLQDRLNELKAVNSVAVQSWSNEFLLNMLEEAKEKLGTTSLHDMDTEQLETVYQLFRTMKRLITSSNRIKSKNIKTSIEQQAKDGAKEISQWKTKRSHKSTQFGFDNLKPYAFFERLGSKTMSALYQNIVDGMYTAAKDMMAADKFRQSVEKKYEVASWKFSKTFECKDAAGEIFYMTLDDALSLYAHSRREQSRLHLFEHGLVLNEELTVERDKKGKIERFKVNDKRNHPLSEAAVSGIVTQLKKENPNYVAYVEEMQDYLSEVMGQKGNEVSVALYDIELFSERHYWPLQTASWWNAYNPEAGVDPKIKSPHFANATNKHATSPIVLQGFSAVWSNHVHDMSMYHGLALPVDDMTRVVNVHTIDNPVAVGGVRQAMEETYGTAAGAYLSQFLRDLNGGVKSVDDTYLSKGVSLAKKAATALSLSVAIQQPSSIMRAMAVIEMKYFGKLDEGLNVKGVYDAWEELKEYCPVAYIKEMGNMETGVGRSAAEHLQKRGFGKAKIKDILKDKNYRKQLGAKIDDIIGFLPQFMDQITWVKIWKAAQNKAQALNPNLSAHEIKMTAAKIFNETIEKTQVYDSPISRTGMMRKKGTAMKEITAYTAEPMATINMAYIAALNVVRGKPGAKRQLGHTMGAILGSTVLNAILKSIITAMRDDDEDETMIEKYIEHFVGNFMSDALLFNNLPIVRDVISLCSGYDVGRMNMATVGFLIDSIEAMTKDGITFEEVLDAVFSVTGLFGVPLKNAKREVSGIVNTVNTIAEEIEGKRTTTWTGIGRAALEGLPFVKEANKGEMLYHAYHSGDSKAIRTYRAYYNSASDANSGIKKALREIKETEIKQAATLRYNGDVKGSARIVERMARENNIPVELVQQAVMTEVEAIVEKNEPEKDPYDGGYDEESSNPSKYTTADLKLAVEQGREVDVIVDSIIADKKAQGFSTSQAKSQVKNSLMSTYKSKYMDAYQTGDKSEMERIISLLVKTGLWDRSAVVNIMKNYIKNEEESK